MNAVETLVTKTGPVQDNDCACPNPQKATVSVEAVSSVTGANPPILLDQDCACPVPAMAETVDVGLQPVANGATIEVTVAVPAA